MAKKQQDLPPAEQVWTVLDVFLDSSVPGEDLYPDIVCPDEVIQPAATIITGTSVTSEPESDVGAAVGSSICMSPTNERALWCKMQEEMHREDSRGEAEGHMEKILGHDVLRKEILDVPHCRSAPH